MKGTLMATLSLNNRSLTVRLSIIERILAMHGDLTLPLTDITAADSTPDGIASVRGLRAPGLGIPGWVKLGTWRRRGGGAFALVIGRGPAIRVHLASGTYREVVVSTRDADHLASQITAAAAGARR